MSNHYAMCKYDDATGTYIPLEARPYIDDFQAGAASRDAEVAELNRKVFALKTPCAVALAALEDFNEQAKWQRIFIPAEIDFAIDRLKEVLK